MATIHDIETKVNNDGMTPQGRLTASDFNTVVKEVQRIDKRIVVISEEEYEDALGSGTIDSTKLYFAYEED